MKMDLEPAVTLTVTIGGDIHLGPTAPSEFPWENSRP